MDGVSTTVGMTVVNGPGAWANGSADVMYRDYIYPLDDGNLTITITNLPAGIYNFYAYACGRVLAPAKTATPLWRGIAGKLSFLTSHSFRRQSGVAATAFPPHSIPDGASGACPHPI